ncbi:MAG: hypothetical protein RL299_1634 [Pseudomonadota bacterium]
MKLLTGTAQLLRLVTGSASLMRVVYSAIDKTGATQPYNFALTPGSGATLAVPTATTTTILTGSATANLERNLKELTVTNDDASVSNTIRIEQFDGTAATILWAGTLLPGERVMFDDVSDWVYYASSGQVKAPVAPGSLIATTVLTAGTTFTTNIATRTIRLRMVGGGGGGGGCTSVAAAASAGGGGGAGGYAERTFTVQGNTGYTYAIGSAGTGVSAGAGNNGGATTFTVSGVTVTAPGGNGAVLATAVTTLIAYAGGTRTAIATNGDLNAAGGAGQMGIIYIAAGAGVAGAGASSQFGAGGSATTTANAGNNSLGFGAGGGGALTGASAARAGGNGTAGCIVVEEFA